MLSTYIVQVVPVGVDTEDACGNVVCQVLT